MYLRQFFMATTANKMASLYTDSSYLTRRELKIALGTSLIDNIWRSIEGYRQEYSKRLRLKTVSQLPITVTYTQALSNKFQNFWTKLSYLMMTYGRLGTSGPEKDAADRYAELILLKSAARLESKLASELALKAMSTGMYRDDNPELRAIFGYHKALRDLEQNFTDPVDENLLGKFYGEICAGEELTSFYRVFEPKAVLNSRTIGGAYECAPAKKIEECLDELWSFLQYDNASPVVKAFATLYMVHFIRPFDAHNDLVASLMAKAVLAGNNLGESMVLLPLENVLFVSEKLKDIMQETQSSGDLTYFICYAIDTLNPLLDAMLNQFNEISRLAIKKEAVETPAPKPEPVKPAEPIEVAPKGETPELVEVEPSPEKIPEPVVEKAVEETPAPAAKEEVKEQPKPKKAEPIREEEQGEVALARPREALNEREVRETARYLLETVPSLRRNQAYFFASHCTLGRYYTIQDYKKATRCAYETARTSMDALARNGFYKKLQIKNKFVYTPIKQGDKE